MTAKLFCRPGFILILCVFGVVGCFALDRSLARTPTAAFGAATGALGGNVRLLSDTTAAGGSVVRFGVNQDCALNSTLVNPCRALIGEAPANYPEVAGDVKSQFAYAGQRVGQTLDLLHTYHPVGSNSLNSAEQYFANQPGTTLFVNWKPAATWAAGASNGNNAAIDTMATSVKTLASKKIFMTLWHEPENDVSPAGDTHCPSLDYKGSAGTVADYRAMWAHMESRFVADGVTNVVWAMDYMNYAPWDCLVPDLYPGNGLVNWVVFNAYANNGGSDTFPAEVARMYDLLTSKNTATDNFLSKPWGIVEWGMDDRGSCAQQAAYYDSAAWSIAADTFSRLKLYMAYDSKDQGNPNAGSDTRTGYCAGQVNQTEQDHYNGFVRAVRGQQ